MNQFVKQMPLNQVTGSEEILLLINESTTKQQKLNFNSQDVGFYVDLFDSYECTYQTDRADILSTETNRMLQYMRTFGSKIIFHSLKNEESKARITDQKEIEEKYDYLNDTAPLFKDICVFDRKITNPADSEGKIHHNILYSTINDYFAKDLQSVVKIAQSLKLSTIFVSGVRVNLWLPTLFDMMKSTHITPIYIYDFSDVAFDWESQHTAINSHKHANKFFAEWMLNHSYLSINHFEFYNLKPVDTKYYQNIQYDGNKKARFFNHFII